VIVQPIAHLAAISREEANDLLIEFGHRIGAFKRAKFACEAHHALFHHGRPVAVTCTSEPVRETVGKTGLRRDECIELARLAAASPALCRPMLRLWREFVLPEIGRVHRRCWGVSYQDKAMHTGNTYRFDGWTDLGAAGGGGRDARSGRNGRHMRVWGWRLAA
jgi:antitoxin VapB